MTQAPTAKTRRGRQSTLTILHYPPHPPYGDWLPVDAIVEYFDHHSKALPDTKKMLERIVTSEIAKPAISKLAKSLDCLGWIGLFRGVIEAAMLPYDVMHRAMDDASRRHSDIIRRAKALADCMDYYVNSRIAGRLDCYSFPDGLVETLRAMAQEMESLRPAYLGIGHAAWASPIQKTDGLAQFVRYFDARLRFNVEIGNSTGGLTVLTPTLMARLAIPALNLNSKDDVLGKTIERVKKFRK